jgi:hypothetical protein
MSFQPATCFVCTYSLNPENVRSKFLRNVGKLLQDCMALQPRKSYSSFACISKTFFITPIVIYVRDINKYKQSNCVSVSISLKSMDATWILFLKAVFLLGLDFDPENGSGTYLRNVIGLMPSCSPLQPRRWYCSNIIRMIN